MILFTSVWKLLGLVVLASFALSSAGLAQNQNMLEPAQDFPADWQLGAQGQDFNFSLLEPAAGVAEIGRAHV